MVVTVVLSKGTVGFSRKRWTLPFKPQLEVPWCRKKVMTSSRPEVMWWCAEKDVNISSPKASGTVVVGERRGWSYLPLPNPFTFRHCGGRWKEETDMFPHQRLGHCGDGQKDGVKVALVILGGVVWLPAGWQWCHLLDRRRIFTLNNVYLSPKFCEYLFSSRWAQLIVRIV